MWADWWLTFKNMVFPIFCRACGRRLLTDENGFFCPTCWEQSPRVERPFCTLCGHPHVGAVGLGTRSNFLCGECLGLKRRPPYRRVFGAARYAGAVEEAIKLFKFHGRHRLAAPLADVMAQFAREEIDCDEYDFLMPIPLHRVKERSRGFNQSRLLAENLLSVFAGASLDESLCRVRPTRSQSTLATEAERKRNVKGAFAAWDCGHLRNKNVMLIDDVVTTRHTVAECAAVLKEVGVGRIDVFATALGGVTNAG